MKAVPKALLALVSFSFICALGSAAQAEKWPAACGPDVGTPPGISGPVEINDASMLAPKTGNIYRTVPMSPAEAQADQQHGITAYYMNDQQREQRRFVIISGQTYRSDGRTLERTANSFNDQMNYVMDAAGNFYLFDENSCPVIRHGSIFDGRPVAGAGNIQIENGKIVMIDSDSGHYFTKPVFASQVIPQLRNLGANPQIR